MVDKDRYGRPVKIYGFVNGEKIPASIISRTYGLNLTTVLTRIERGKKDYDLIAPPADNQTVLARAREGSIRARRERCAAKKAKRLARQRAMEQEKIKSVQQQLLERSMLPIGKGNL